MIVSYWSKQIEVYEEILIWPPSELNLILYLLYHIYQNSAINIPVKSETIILNFNSNLTGATYYIIHCVVCVPLISYMTRFEITMATNHMPQGFCS